MDWLWMYVPITALAMRPNVRTALWFAEMLHETHISYTWQSRIFFKPVSAQMFDSIKGPTSTINTLIPRINTCWQGWAIWWNGLDIDMKVYVGEISQVSSLKHYLNLYTEDNKQKYVTAHNVLFLTSNCMGFVSVVVKSKCNSMTSRVQYCYATTRGVMIRCMDLFSARLSVRYVCVSQFSSL